jgi:AcrR family transcriptional regulator
VPVTSPIATARREQIVAAAIEVIASAGFGQASFARIAEHAGLSSTRLISYHFAGKADLMATVAATVVESIGAHVGQLVAAETTARGQLRAYLRGVVGFVAENRAQMVALQAVFLAGAMDYDAATEQEVVTPLEGILRRGQDAGEFRDFDPMVMATTVQRSVDGLPFLLEVQPDLDLAAYADELVTLFDLGTRA